MDMPTPRPLVLAIDELDLSFSPRPWPFADARRAEIDAYFATLQRDKPALFNGRVLVMHTHAFAGKTLQGAYLETDFASFLSWRNWDFPDNAMRNCFALGALRCAEGAFLLGVMGEHTANAGRIYFPGGTPDPSDVVDGKVDLGASVLREVAEETGLTATDLVPDPGWTAILAGARIALIKTLQASIPAEALRARILTELAGQSEPELASMYVVRGRTDLDERMPPFIHAFFETVWA